MVGPAICYVSNSRSDGSFSKESNKPATKPDRGHWIQRGIQE